MLSVADVEALDELAEIIRFHAPVVAFTGAGISTESGIPDYRGKDGLWTSGKATPVTYQEFMGNPDVRFKWWEEFPQRVISGERREPNDGHRALVRLEQAGILGATITQNIDGLHLDGGTNPDLLIELHGNTQTIRCTDCGTVWPAREFLERFRGWDGPPPCPECGGIVKSGTIAFGQPLVEADIQRALQIAQHAGVMLVVGSTLLVYPAAQVPLVAKESGAFLAIINKGETGLDDIADLRLDAPSGQALSYLANQVLSADE